MEHRVLYLSRVEVESLAIPMATVIERTEWALREKGTGNSIMPAKHWIAPDGERFFSAMTGALPGIGGVTCKWQSGSRGNSKLGLPYITGLLILNDLDSGLPKAIMDSTWITAQRTAAATAVTARYLARHDTAIVGVIGCGVQGRANVEALRVVFPELREVHAFDIDPERLDAYANEVAARHGILVRQCETVHDTVSRADVVVTCGPIVSKGDRIIERSWLSPGGLLVTLDYDCYLNPSTIGEFDRIFTDDLDQMCHLRAYGFFTAVPDNAVELGSVIAGRMRGRSRPEETILSLNMGIAIEDAALADVVEQRAREQGTGTWLPL